MEIQSPNVNSDVKQKQKTGMLTSMKSDVNFADELKSLKGPEEAPAEEVKQEETQAKTAENKDSAKTVSKVNQEDDNSEDNVKDIKKNADKENKGADVINNDYNVENKDKLPQMLPNMNFGGDGQPFSSFMNNNGNNNDAQLMATAKDLAEEAAILSTMAENIAMANKAGLNYQEGISEKVSGDGEIKKVDTRTSMVTDIIVQHDSVIMNEADVEMFNSLVNGTPVNLNNITADAAQKSVRVSKTLADLLAKAMETNKPVRIEFDNGISVIIKISRDGKLSADFLPSTQVAEAYLKENLPLLKQKFNEQNLDYEELNQRERRNQDRDQNKKKGQENE